MPGVARSLTLPVEAHLPTVPGEGCSQDHMLSYVRNSLIHNARRSSLAYIATGWSLTHTARRSLLTHTTNRSSLAHSTRGSPIPQGNPSHMYSNTTISLSPLSIPINYKSEGFFAEFEPPVLDQVLIHEDLPPLLTTILHLSIIIFRIFMDFKYYKRSISFMYADECIWWRYSNRVAKSIWKSQ